MRNTTETTIAKSISWSTYKDRKTSSTIIVAVDSISGRDLKMSLQPFTVKKLTLKEFDDIVQRFLHTFEVMLDETN
jgi:hypothetical protein